MQVPFSVTGQIITSTGTCIYSVTYISTVHGPFVILACFSIPNPCYTGQESSDLCSPV